MKTKHRHDPRAQHSRLRRSEPSLIQQTGSDRDDLGLLFAHINAGAPLAQRRSDDILTLQRVIGNRATQAFVSRSRGEKGGSAALNGRSIQRDGATPRANASGSSGVRFSRFLAKGSGLTGKQLGPLSLALHEVNAVELQFAVDSAAHRNYRNLRPVQWSGPEAIWVKYGDPFAQTWQVISKGPGTGSDNPKPEFIAVRPDAIAYYDSPGPFLLGHLSKRPSRIHVVQNFTGWIVGERRAGGGTERLCPVAAWYSVISLADYNWSDRTASPDYQRISPSGSGTGWRSTANPPAI